MGIGEAAISRESATIAISLFRSFRLEQDRRRQSIARAIVLRWVSLERVKRNGGQAVLNGA